MKVYITGRKSYIANYLIQFLQAKGIYAYSAHASIKNYEFLLTDMAQVNPDIVIHVAQCTDKNNFTALKNLNIIGTKNVIQAMQSIHCNKLIFLSTTQLYNCRKPSIQHEYSPLLVNNNYTVSKLSAEHIIYAAHNISSIIVRTCEVVGYTKDYCQSFFDKLYFSALSQSVLHFKPLRYEFLGLQDMANGYYLLLVKLAKSTRKTQEIFNLSNDCNYHKIIIIAAWQKYLRSLGKIRIKSIMNYSIETPIFNVCNTSKLKYTTGWTVRQSLEDIIATYPVINLP